MTIAVIAMIARANAISIVLLVHLIVNGPKVDARRADPGGDPHVVRERRHLRARVLAVRRRRAGRAPQLPDGRATSCSRRRAPEFAPPGWRAEFLDYLYLSFTNSVAFSPTDALPLTRGAKMLMLVEAATSLLLLVMVAARAVNVSARCSS